MNNIGWCPLISKGDEFKSKCITKECAWWDTERNDCIVFSIKKKLKDIEDKGDEIIYKMNN